MIAIPVGENHMIVASFVSTKHRNVMEIQTDRRTDPIMAYTAVSIAMPTAVKTMGGGKKIDTDDDNFTHMQPRLP